MIDIYNIYIFFFIIPYLIFYQFRKYLKIKLKLDIYNIYIYIFFIIPYLIFYQFRKYLKIKLKFP